MNFELKTLDLKAAAEFNTDAVVVLLPNHFKPGRDAISQLVTKARANADLDDSVGKLLKGLNLSKLVTLDGGTSTNSPPRGACGLT